MAYDPDPELCRLQDELDAARTADIPDLVEVRRCRKRFIKCLARLVREYMREHEERPADALQLTVITNDTPVPGAPRGICSPVKTAEIRRFEQQVRAVFGNTGACTTSWRGPGHRR